MRTTLLPLLLIGALILPAHAHDKPTVGPNGGELRDVDGYHLELVVKPQGKSADDVRESPLVVYVTDAKDAKVSTQGATGKASLLSGKLRADVTLTADGDNRLKGIVKVGADREMRAIVTVNLPGKAPLQVRFVPLAPRKP